jgi:hypothetical protein
MTTDQERLKISPVRYHLCRSVAKFHSLVQVCNLDQFEDKKLFKTQSELVS